MNPGGRLFKLLINRHAVVNSRKKEQPCATAAAVKCYVLTTSPMAGQDEGRRYLMMEQGSSDVIKDLETQGFSDFTTPTSPGLTGSSGYSSADEIDHPYASSKACMVEQGQLSPRGMCSPGALSVETGSQPPHTPASLVSPATTASSSSASSSSLEMLGGGGEAMRQSDPSSMITKMHEFDTDITGDLSCLDEIIDDLLTSSSSATTTLATPSSMTATPSSSISSIVSPCSFWNNGQFDGIEMMEVDGDGGGVGDNTNILVNLLKENERKQQLQSKLCAQPDDGHLSPSTTAAVITHSNVVLTSAALHSHGNPVVASAGGMNTPPLIKSPGSSPPSSPGGRAQQDVLNNSNATATSVLNSKVCFSIEPLPADMTCIPSEGVMVSEGESMKFADSLVNQQMLESLSSYLGDSDSLMVDSGIGSVDAQMDNSLNGNPIMSCMASPTDSPISLSVAVASTQPSHITYPQVSLVRNHGHADSATSSQTSSTVARSVSSSVLAQCLSPPGSRAGSQVGSHRTAGYSAGGLSRQHSHPSFTSTSSSSSSNSSSSSGTTSRAVAYAYSTKSSSRPPFLDDHRYTSKQPESPPAPSRNIHAYSRSKSLSSAHHSRHPPSCLEALLLSDHKLNPQRGSEAAYCATEGISQLQIGDGGSMAWDQTGDQHPKLLKKLLTGEMDQHEVQRSEQEVIQDRRQGVSSPEQPQPSPTSPFHLDDPNDDLQQSLNDLLGAGNATMDQYWSSTSQDEQGSVVTSELDEVYKEENRQKDLWLEYFSNDLL